MPLEATLFNKTPCVWNKLEDVTNHVHVPSWRRSTLGTDKHVSAMTESRRQHLNGHPRLSYRDRLS